MPRYPWIPSKKQGRVPSTRPVTILDTPPADGGWEYRASYCGIPLQVFSQAPIHGNLLQTGDTIIARWVPGAGQLWFPSPERPEALYFSPGGLWPGAWVNWKGELWKYDGANPPTHVWTPTALLLEHPSCLAWCKATQRLYIWTFGYELVTWKECHRIYKLNPTDDSVVFILEHNQDDDIPSWWDTPMDVAEFPLDGCLYVHFGWYGGGTWSRVIAFDPVTETERLAFIYPVTTWAGGICYHPGIGKLLAFSGYQMYESANGVNFVLNNNLNLNFGIYDSGPMVLNPSDGNVYLAVEWCRQAPNPGEGGIMKYDGVNWTIDYQCAGSGGGNEGFKAVGNLYPLDGGPVETVAGYWAWWYATDQASVHKKTAGVWGLDWVGPPIDEGWVHITCQTMVTLKGELCVLLFDRTTWVPGTFGSRLYKRDILGAYAQVTNFANYRCYETYAYTMCMSPVRTARKCHEL